MKKGIRTIRIVIGAGIGLASLALLGLTLSQSETIHDHHSHPWEHTHKKSQIPGPPGQVDQGQPPGSQRESESKATFEIGPLAREAQGPACRRNFGKVGIFMIFTRYAAYSHATNTLRCYALSKGYEIFVVHAYEDPLTKKVCEGYKDVFFRKHCVASYYLEKVDWLFVSDADTAVFNSDHCIEEWLDPKADLIMYERFFTSEIVSGNYLVRNSPAGKHFLRGWASMEFEKPPLESGIFMSADNGFLHNHLIRTVFPEQQQLDQRCMGYLNESIWPKYEPGFGKFIRCAKEALIQQKSSPHARANILIFPRAQAWVRDTVFTGHDLWEGDFMSHGIKEAKPFDLAMLERLARFVNDTMPVECWNPGWRPKLIGAKFVPIEELRRKLQVSGDQMEKSGMKPIFADMDFEKCWPNCKPLFKNF